MKRVARVVAPELVVLLALVLLAALWAPLTLPSGPRWGECRVEWCRPSEEPQDPAGDALGDAAAVTRLGCEPMALWPEGEIPAALAVRPVSGGPVEVVPFARAWRLAEAGTVWTLGACRKG